MAAEAIDTSSKTKTTIINVRANAAVKGTISRAAEILGQSLSDFVLPDAYARAKKILEERGDMVLSDADRQAFVGAFLEPANPPAGFRKAVEAYKAEEPA